MSHACHRFWKCYKTLTFCSLWTRCTIPCACHAKRHLNLQKWREHVIFCTFSLRNVLRATTACTFSTSQLPKVVRAWCVLYILTSKCASRHNGVHFFDIATSKSGPSMVCFVHFDFEMCFAPQRHALFRHRNFQKWSEQWCALSFLTSKCASRHNGVPLFRHLNFQKWSEHGALYILTSKCASRHNGVQFFISHLASWLLFDPPEPQIIGKTQCFATFLPFRASASSFF